MSMQVKLWGLRGSLPAPVPPSVLEAKLQTLLNRYSKEKDASNMTPEDFLKTLHPWEVGGFGGHTACVQVTTGDQTLIIDGGSGIRLLGEELLKGPCGQGKGEVHLLFTHFHWDHLIGLPFFVPIFLPGNKIHMYAVQDNLESAVRTMFKKPNFPVPFERLGAEIFFHKLEPRTKVNFGNLDYTPYKLDHPDPCWGYRFEHEGKVFSYCVDTEAVRVSRQELGPDLPLYQNVDLMVFDAQYSFLEAAERIDWGHASAPIGIDIGLRENIKKMVFIHHDPAATDEKIADAENQTQFYYDSCVQMAAKGKSKVHEFEWLFGREGMVFDV